MKETWFWVLFGAVVCFAGEALVCHSPGATIPVQVVDVPTTQAVATRPAVAPRRGGGHAGRHVTTPVGDLNCDGVVDFCDINPFVDALTNEGQYLLDYGYDCAYRGFLPYPFAADCNLDGVVDMADINPFVDILLGGPIPNFVPIIRPSRPEEAQP